MQSKCPGVVVQRIGQKSIAKPIRQFAIFGTGTIKPRSSALIKAGIEQTPRRPFSHCHAVELITRIINLVRSLCGETARVAVRRHSTPLLPQQEVAGPANQPRSRMRSGPTLGHNAFGRLRIAVGQDQTMAKNYLFVNRHFHCINIALNRKSFTAERFSLLHQHDWLVHYVGYVESLDTKRGGTNYFAITSRKRDPFAGMASLDNSFHPQAGATGPGHAVQLGFALLR
jgi:hypothetical protein